MTRSHSDVILSSSAAGIPTRPDVFASLRCPFEARRNPNIEAAAVAARAWLELTFGATRGTKRLVRAHMEELTAGFYPESDATRLTFATRFLYWAFTLDDLVDETDVGRGTKALASLFKELDHVLSGAPASGQDPLHSGLAELLNDLSAWASNAELASFRDAMRAYFGALLWEANNRACSWVPDEVSFKLLRPAAGAVPPFWDLIGPVNGVRLGTVGFDDPRLERLRQLAGGIVCWYNDVLSFEKERDAGDVHNLVIVYMKRRDLSAREAFAAAIEFCNVEVDAFVDTAAALLNTAPSLALRRYVATLESMMATTLHWTFGSQRYAGLKLEPSSRLSA